MLQIGEPLLLINCDPSIALSFQPSACYTLTFRSPHRSTLFCVAQQISWDLSHLAVEVYRSHTIINTHTRAVGFLCTSNQPVAKRPLPTQHTTNTREEHTCPQRESNALSQQSISRRPTHWTAQSPRSATIVPSPTKPGPLYCSMLQGGRLKIITFSRRTFTGSLNQLNVSTASQFLCLKFLLVLSFPVSLPLLRVSQTSGLPDQKLCTFVSPVQQNSTYPDAGYPGRQLSESAWPFG